MVGTGVHVTRYVTYARRIRQATVEFVAADFGESGGNVLGGTFEAGGNITGNQRRGGINDHF